MQDPGFKPKTQKKKDIDDTIWFTQYHEGLYQIFI